jgi:hypothetical protein
MFMIFGRIKDMIIATLALALPIIYIMGRVKGKAAERNRVLRDDLKTKEKINKFYKAMAEHEDDPSTSDRDSFLKRLRRDGL